MADSWKEVSKQSERQLGAFHFMYLAAFKKALQLPKQNTKIVEFRNRVVHQGVIPTRQEATDYAEYVFTLIRDLSRELTQLDEDALARVRGEHVKPAIAKLEAQAALQGGKKPKPFAVRYGMMLHPWSEPESDDFVWSLEALAFRIKDSGAGILAEDKPFTRFDPEADE